MAATPNLGIELGSKAQPYLHDDRMIAALTALDAAIVAGAGITVVFDTATKTATLAVDPEYIRDQVALFLVAGAGMTIVHNDAANTLTLTSP